MKANGMMPHDTTEQRQAVIISRASARRELARIVVAEIVPELQRLGQNDAVTQHVCKAILATLDAIKTQMESDAKRLLAVEAMLGIVPQPQPPLGDEAPVILDTQEKKDA